MDFMKLLKSLEELLYELVSWILFYPVTLWRAITRPSKMMAYADSELADSDDEQYTDVLNPPLFLMISLVLAHGLELKLFRSNAAQLPSLLADDSNLLIFRAVMFSIFPLFMAWKFLRFQKLPLDRRSLKPPFYSQCYVAAPFVLALSLANTLLRLGTPATVTAAAALAAMAVLWYGVAETRWLVSSLGLSRLRAAFSVSLTLIEATVVIIAVLLMLVRF
jgi:hypothetical protein